MTVLLVGLGGALGAVCRYAISSLPVRTGFPVLTLVINFFGAVVIGAVAEWAGSSSACPAWVPPLLKTGFCGGFTTFSTFSLESVTLWENGQHAASAAYAVLSVICCAAGVMLGRLLFRRLHAA